MNKEYLIIRQVPGEKPSVKFIGPETDAKSMMFHIIMNSENGFKKLYNDEGYEIVVNEKTNDWLNNPLDLDILEVTYYLYPLKEKYE